MTKLAAAVILVATFGLYAVAAAQIRVTPMVPGGIGPMVPPGAGSSSPAPPPTDCLVGGSDLSQPGCNLPLYLGGFL